MLTYQDFEKAILEGTKEDFLIRLISEHKASDLYRIATDADLYDRQKNRTINEYVKMMFTLTGTKVEDFTASNAKIASNFFHRLNTQRCTYSLGNGVSFSDHVRKQVGEDGVEVSVDETKEKLGDKFDTQIKKIGYYGLIHGLSFGMLNVDKLHLFKITEFAPMWDEEDGRLRAGVRFWQLDPTKPLTVTLYEEDGVTEYKGSEGGKLSLTESKAKRPYKIVKSKAPIEAESTIVGESNYGSLPIVPFWGSDLHQSTLVGMRQGIDSFDLIRSGFANDLTDCSQIYWIIENCGGLSTQELAQIRDRMKLNHIISADTSSGGKVTPYTQEVPYQARAEYLGHIRSGIYEDFGGLDVHTVAAGATNDHIDAAYQPLDENADDFEYQLIEFIQQILTLMGIEDTPTFKRNRISNQKEQTEMLMMVREDLDAETFLNKLPFLSPDEVAGILARKDQENESRYTQEGAEPPQMEEIEEVVV